MPRIDERLVTKLEGLIASSSSLGNRANEYGQLESPNDRAACRGWITTALATVEMICSATNAYRETVRKLAESNYAEGLLVHEVVLQIAAILRQLVADANGGLLTSVADIARAETCVEFLYHGGAYLRENRKMESGVIVGVVFEDTVRKICEKNQITQSGRQLDDLISELQNADKIKPVQAKRARVAALVWTKATHAQWDQFELSDVEEALKFTEDLIEQHLSSE